MFLNRLPGISFALTLLAILTFAACQQQKETSNLESGDGFVEVERR